MIAIWSGNSNGSIILSKILVPIWAAHGNYVQFLNFLRTKKNSCTVEISLWKTGSRLGCERRCCVGKSTNNISYNNGELSSISDSHVSCLGCFDFSRPEKLRSVNLGTTFGRKWRLRLEKHQLCRRKLAKIFASHVLMLHKLLCGFGFIFSLLIKKCHTAVHWSVKWKFGFFLSLELLNYYFSIMEKNVNSKDKSFEMWVQGWWYFFYMPHKTLTRLSFPFCFPLCCTKVDFIREGFFLFSPRKNPLILLVAKFFQVKVIFHVFLQLGVAYSSGIISVQKLYDYVDT